VVVVVLLLLLLHLHLHLHLHLLRLHTIISCRYENCEFLPLRGEMHVLCTDHHSGKCYTPGAGAHLPPLPCRLASRLR